MTAHENPLGLHGFEFVEFIGPDPDALAGLFAAMGVVRLNCTLITALVREAPASVADPLCSW